MLRYDTQKAYDKWRWLADQMAIINYKDTCANSRWITEHSWLGHCELIEFFHCLRPIYA